MERLRRDALCKTFYDSNARRREGRWGKKRSMASKMIVDTSDI